VSDKALRRELERCLPHCLDEMIGLMAAVDTVIDVVEKAYGDETYSFYALKKLRDAQERLITAIDQSPKEGTTNAS